MNRRNFVVGLGTVATVSGVASVTAASFADSIEAGADFRVIVDEELTVRLGDGVPAEGDLGTEASWRDTSLYDADGLTTTFDDTDDGQIAYVDYSQGDPPINGDIQFELALLNNDEETNTGYENLLNIDNEGVNDQEVGIKYIYGEDVDTSDESFSNDQLGTEGPVSAELVNQLFVFELPDGTEQLSPDDADVEEPGQVTVTPGDNQIDFTIDLTDTRAETLADAANVGEGIFDEGGVEENLDLLDNIEVGLIDNDGT